jgi:hypothetical protein
MAYTFLANSGDAWDGASGMVWKKLALSTALECSQLPHHINQVRTMLPDIGHGCP